MRMPVYASSTREWGEGGCRQAGGGGTQGQTDLERGRGSVPTDTEQIQKKTLAQLALETVLVILLAEIHIGCLATWSQGH